MIVSRIDIGGSLGDQIIAKIFLRIDLIKVWKRLLWFDFIWMNRIELFSTGQITLISRISQCIQLTKIYRHWSYLIVFNASIYMTNNSFNEKYRKTNFIQICFTKLLIEIWILIMKCNSQEFLKVDFARSRTSIVIKSYSTK